MRVDIHTQPTRNSNQANPGTRHLVPLVLAVLFCCLGVLTTDAEVRPKATKQCVDVRCDLVRLGLYERNAAGDGQANDSAPIQAAIDFVAENGGGYVLVPPGVYRVANINVREGVHLVGAGWDETIFRAWSTPNMFQPTGGWLENFTAYGTQTAERSGDNWVVGTEGKGKGGSATAAHIIALYDAKDVHIDHVRAMESRYDCLYVRGSRGLTVTNCRFDRAGRNIVSMVGNDEEFLFADCYIGSHWGLYHFDIEPVTPRYVRDGLFVNCTFDGRKAGELGTDTWGAFMCFVGGDNLQNRDITVTGCRFYRISIRVRGVFPGVKFLYNPVMGGVSSVFMRVKTNPVGEFRDSIVRGNRFIIDGKPAKRVNSGVSFTGNSVFEDNEPDWRPD